VGRFREMLSANQATVVSGSAPAAGRPAA